MPQQDNTDYKELIYKLTTELVNYNYAYHNLNETIVSDDVYDVLYKELKELEQEYPEYQLPNSPTLRVGDSVVANNSLSLIKHSEPMLSLNNIFSDPKEEDPFLRHHELFAFCKKIRESITTTKESSNLEYVVSPKYDGIAISLVYIDGVLKTAVTRGDGYVGEDVTSNAKLIKNLPQLLHKSIVNKTTSIPHLLELRGEILIKNTDFIAINEYQKNNQLKVFANPRNLAAGTMRHLDSNKITNRPLYFFAYSLVRCVFNDKQQNITADLLSEDTEALHFETFYEQLLYLKNLGFDIGDLTINDVSLLDICSNETQLITYYEHILKYRDQLPFGIDGVVYKINAINIQNQLGYVLRAPKFAIANKFPAQTVVSQIITIEAQVGRTGAITPVAKITPVAVGGVVVSNVSLHNYDEILRKDIKIGDHVLVRRAGDVIPEIVSVLVNYRSDNHIQDVIIPSVCPICNSILHKLEGEAIIRCTGGLYCDMQKKQAIIHFTSKLALNIDGCGEALITQLVDNKLVNNITDLYKLQKDQLLMLNNFDTKLQKRANNIITAINNSKQTTLNRLIYALGIRHVGEAIAKTLAKHYKTLDKLMQASLEELSLLPDIGIVVASSINNFFKDQHNIAIIAELLRLGITYELNEQVNATNSNLSLLNKKFVVTGTLANISRDEVYALIESNGGNIQSNVNKNTNYVVVGENAGSKLTKANELNIPTLTLEQLYSMLK